MSEIPTLTVESQANLEALKLRPGSFLKIHQAGKSDALCQVKLLGIVSGKGVMVGLNSDGSDNKILIAGTDYNVRGFSGQHDFSFATKVAQIFQEPIAYAILTYPNVVESSVVRKAIRTKISIPGKAFPEGKSLSFDVTLIDLNMGGAKVDTIYRIGPPGDVLKLVFSAIFEQNQIEMSLAGTIRYTIKSESGEGYSVGIEFNDISRDDKLVLHYIASHEYSAG